MVRYLGNTVPSDFTFSPDFSFLVVGTNKSHTYQLVISTVIKFLSCLYENEFSHVPSDQILQPKLFS